MRSLQQLAFPVLLVALLGGLVGCDQLTKRVAQTELQHRPPRELVPRVLELRYAENRGVAFSLFSTLTSGRRAVLSLLGLVVLGIVGAAWWHTRKNTSRLGHVGYALIVAGAIGNLADRLWRGFVVDFVHLRGWPIFNLADVYILAGVMLLLCARAPGADQADSTRAR